MFSKYFSKIATPLKCLLEKDVPFTFTTECKHFFDLLKENLTSASILTTPDLTLPFELMCDASEFTLGAVLGQWKGNRFHPIYYARKSLNDAQRNYTTMEKELLALVFAVDKLGFYLVLSDTVVFTDHAAIRYLMSKLDAKSRSMMLVS